eukprot:gnl/MRDRNA2_/MRDRNA2_164440_c0_seq1.p1 gnl/MRDRNA2_/MRDRNA2_164440_c0~~gnl/MRDRNA2_/MRDRNA2_164440_c0_seq1.p1  ORF type:complete len:265 (-),score=35.64 gnl/MRDRNA2_/MRDRNA2_164440_c0_seq1:93-887(-)
MSCGKGLISEKFAADTAAILRSKDAQVERGIKCGLCWQLKRRCFCARVQPLRFHLRCRFLVYMSREDYLCGGDDAKLIRIAAPDRCHIFVHGRTGDDERFADALAAGDLRSTVMLFPSKDAGDAGEWLEEVSTLRPLSGHLTQKLLTIIVLDAPWQKARRLANHLSAKIAAGVPRVALSPETLSVYHRTQTTPDRICTVEAVALFLQLAGEASEVCVALIELVKINNAALVSPEKPSLWAAEGGHPAWYFGRRINDNEHESRKK